MTGPDIIYDYIKSMLGTKYRWAGDNPLSGYDCSGLVVEILKASGVISEGSDLTAEGLRQKYSDRIVPFASFGTLVFYGKTQATHVGFCLDQYFMVEAAGGDSGVTNTVEASAKSAFVKVRPIFRRNDLLGLYQPKYTWE